jgi:fucose 4-O-acetylase-like acetyltransferase
MEAKSRLEFVDIAKGIGIMIVCFGHSGAEDVVISWIGGFIVPLFFILSGYMYKDKGIPVGKDLYNKGKKLLKPYLFFSVVLLLIYKRFAWNDIVGVFYSRYCLYTYHAPDNIFFMKATNSPMWFLTAMFATFPLFYIIMKNEKYIKWIVLSYLLITWGCTFLPILLPWSLDVAFIMAIFMYIGVLFRRQENLLNKPSYIYGLIIAAFLILCKVNGEPNPSVRELGHSLLLYMITGVLGSISMMWICKHLEGKPLSGLLADIGRHTLVIFCLQIFVFHQINRVIYGMIHLPAEGIWLYTAALFKVIVASIICMYISKYMNRYMPWLFR